MSARDEGEVGACCGCVGELKVHVERLSTWMLSLARPATRNHMGGAGRARRERARERGSFDGYQKSEATISEQQPR